MNRKKKILRNLVLGAFLSWLFLQGSGLYLTPRSAHEHSELYIHYGPSEVVHVEPFDGGQYFLGKFDRWVSCNEVNRTLGLFWSFGDQPIGFENDTSKGLDFSWRMDDGNFAYFGIVNDKRIVKVELTDESGSGHVHGDLYDDLFLFTFPYEGELVWGYKSIRGYDAQGELVYEEIRK